MKIATGSFSKHVNKTQFYDSKSLNISYQLTFAAMGRLKAQSCTNIKWRSQKGSICLFIQ